MKAIVYYNHIIAGHLEKTAAQDYIFDYDDQYFNDSSKPSISLTLPKKNKSARSKTLFPFFYGVLTEGINKEIQCRLLKLDEDDHFSRLLKTAGNDTIGAVTIKPAI